MGEVNTRWKNASSPREKRERDQEKWRRDQWKGERDSKPERFRIVATLQD